MFKYLEPLKKIKLNDDLTASLITKAYDYHQNRILPELTEEEKQNAQILSCFIRFFKCINSGRKIDEEFLQNYFKNEVLKDKPKSIQNLNNYRQEIIAIQSSRLLFSTEGLPRPLKDVTIKSNSKGNNIKQIINFDYKIDVVISSVYSNRMLVPEICFVFTLDDGSQLKMKIDLRMYNEFRKNLALNIKKMLENENVNLLK